MIKTWQWRMKHTEWPGQFTREDCMQAQIDELRAEVLRLCGEVSNRNARALAGDKAQTAFDELYDEHELLRAELEKIKQQEPYCFAVVEPATKNCKFPEVVFTAQCPEDCHEHINDAISEHGCGSKWVVRKLYLSPGAQPVLDVKERLGAILDGWKSGVVSAQDSIVEVFKLRAMLEAAKP